MSGQCLCSWCVEARNKIREYVPSWITDWWLPEPQHPELPADDLRGLAAYDQARAWDRVAAAAARARAMREARERAGATCP